MRILKPLLIVFITLITFSSLGITVTNRAIEKKDTSTKNETEEIKETYCIGRVTKIISDIKEELPGGNIQRSQALLIQIVSGADKGKERVTENSIPDNPAFAIIGEVGKKYLITKIENTKTGNEDYFIVDYYREKIVFYLVGAFLIVLIIIGGLKGFRAIVSLLVTIALIAILLIPSIEKGINPLCGAIIVSFLSTAFTMILVAGFNFKSLSSTLGTLVGVTASGLIAALVIKVASLSGLASTEAMILWGNQLFEINFKGLLAAGMIVSCLGAVMDVAISISSSIQEIKTANPSYSFKELFKSGMNIGKDIMGTMTNTLVLAYTGMGLPLLLLISHEKNPMKFLNLELVVSELTAAIAGSIGLIISVPATCIIMSLLVQKEARKEM